MSQTTDTPSTFEFFQGTLSESSTSPRITVRRGGLMVITRAAVDLLGDEVSRVQLAYNRTTGDVGIRAVGEETPGSYLLRIQPKSPSRLVSGSGSSSTTACWSTRPGPTPRTTTATASSDSGSSLRPRRRSPPRPRLPRRRRRPPPGRPRPRRDAGHTVDHPSRTESREGFSCLVMKLGLFRPRREPATNPSPTG